MADFLSFLLVGALIGGDAIHGYRSDGVAYLSEHGRFTQVSLGTYYFSVCHALSVLVAFPVALACAYRVVSQRRT
jgi:hypothetical protein